MKKVKINSEKCKGCLLCISVCPNNCLKVSDKINKSGHKYVELINEEKCKFCSFCFIMCPDVAIEIVEE
ncbi:MAG: hypothetical protein A2474_06760 [Elusimicrobia bacterium RIFOXYC2_FULL_34_12]|nr:MAG: hypothetical protein A2474_06760 [Elusimicrobia bacterium RIFOXYC2_FULL_34_12]OGS39692.1 MAG: hypothetical protein A2551_06765 [Elusimicrobia bacterium RIFOXYD2_FULL_34_30]HAM39622.1 hypothetical protein [Elusimicrobiota bacterium]